MAKKFLKTMQGRTMLMLFLFLSISMGVSLYFITYVSQKAINSEKEAKLLQIAEHLCSQLDGASYTDILISRNARDASRDEKIKVLNNALKARTDETASIFRGLAVGYYSLELDAILTYGPSYEYNRNVGVSIDAEHPGRIVMEKAEPMVKIGSMVRGNIMNAMVPIVHGGEVIGYVWANELTSDIQNDYQKISVNVIVIHVVCFILAIIVSMILTRRMMFDIDLIISGVKDMRNNLSKRLPSMEGDLSEVSESINNMADHLERNAKEHEALLLAKAANVAQRDFLSRMSHEIRTPMNGVLGMTSLAIQADSQEKTMEYLQKIQASAKLLLGVINDILDFSKIEANMLQLEVRPFNLRKAINTLYEILAPRIEEKKLSLNISVEESVPVVVMGDELKLSQVLMNLLGNAVKFSENGEINLAVYAETTEEEKLKLICSVSDTGIGISEDQIKNLFQPFTQADGSMARKYGGTGLGLSISKAFVNLMGGDISVHSNINEGSVFEFYILLEQCEEQELLAEEAREKVLDLRFDGIKALIAEDVEINQEIAMEVLSDFGFVCDIAENGKMAVDMYSEKTYELIFMDIRMPVMDGIEATRNIRKLEAEKGVNSHIPIIAMTANVMKEDRELCFEAGMNAHVSKPIDVEEIEDALYRIFNMPASDSC